MISRHDPNLTVQKVYFPEDSPLTVCLSPDMLPAGFYWYGAKRRSKGRTPTWLQRMLNAATPDDTVRPTTESASGPQEEDLLSEDSGRLTSPDVPHFQSPEPVCEDTPAEDVHNDVTSAQRPIDLSEGEPRKDDVESVASDHEQGSEDAAQQHNLQDLSVLPYAVHAHMQTTLHLIYNSHNNILREASAHVYI